MRLPFRLWTTLFAKMGRVLRNRKQRKAQEEYRRRRRALNRQHSFDHLEARVVLSGDSPAANDDGSYGAYQDTALHVPASGVLANDTDPESDSLTATLVTGPSYAASFTLYADGSFDYMPASGFTGDDGFTYTAHDGTSDSAAATVSIQVVAPNHPPSSPDLEYEVANDAVLEVDAEHGLLSAATDEDNDPLSVITYESGTNAGGYVVINSNGSFTYTPPSGGFTGQDYLDVEITDGTATSETFQAWITVTAAAAANAAPGFTAGGDVNVDEDSGNYSQGWATDVSPGPANESGQSLAFIVGNDNENLFEEQPAIDAAGNLTFKPAANAHGTATVTVRLEDDGGTANGGDDTSDEVEFTISIAPINDTPTVEPSQSPTINEDEPAEFGGEDVDGDELTASIVAYPSHGTLSVNGSVVVYTPDENWSGTTEFQYKLNDGTIDSATATVSLSVRAVNDAPSFTPGGNVEADEDGGEFSGTWATDVSTGPGDESGQSMEFIVTTDNPGLFASGPAIDASGNLTFTPAANAHGTATATVRLQDNGGNEYGGDNTTSEIEFTITVHPTNDAPTGADNEQTIDEDTFAIVGGGDVDGDPLTAILISEPSHGTVMVNSNGTITYVPNLHFSGASDSFQYKVRDPDDVESETVTAVITITPVQDPPTTTDDTIEVDEDGEVEITRATLLANDGDPDDGDELTITQITSGPAHGTLTETENGWLYVPDENYFGPDQFSYEITDNHEHTDSAVVTINVLPVNDPPSFELDDVPVTAAMNAGEVTLADFAFNLSKGTAANEATPTFAFELTSDNPELFTATGQPTITWNATTEKYDLKFTPQFAGSALVTVVLKDTAPAGENSGIAYSAPQTFWIEVTEPVFLVGGGGGGGGGTSNGPVGLPAESQWAVRALVFRDADETEFNFDSAFSPHAAHGDEVEVEVSFGDTVETGSSISVAWGDESEAETIQITARTMTLNHTYDFGDDEGYSWPSSAANLTLTFDQFDPAQSFTLPVEIDRPQDELMVDVPAEIEEGDTVTISGTFNHHGNGEPIVVGYLRFPEYSALDEGPFAIEVDENGAYEFDLTFSRHGEYQLVIEAIGNAPIIRESITVTDAAAQLEIADLLPVEEGVQPLVLAVDLNDLGWYDFATVTVDLGFEDAPEIVFHDVSPGRTIIIESGTLIAGDNGLTIGIAPTNIEGAYPNVAHTITVTAAPRNGGAELADSTGITVSNIAPVGTWTDSQTSQTYWNAHEFGDRDVEDDLNEPDHHYVTATYQGRIEDRSLTDELAFVASQSSPEIRDFRWMEWSDFPANSVERTWENFPYWQVKHYEFKVSYEFTGPIESDPGPPSLSVTFSDGDESIVLSETMNYAVTPASYSYPLVYEPISSVAVQIIDGLAGEPMSLPDGTEIDDGIVLRATRSFVTTQQGYAHYVKQNGQYVLDLLGDRVIFYAEQAAPTTGEASIDVEIRPKTTTGPAAGSAADWESDATYTITIEAGKNVAYKTIKPVDDDAKEWDETYEVFAADGNGSLAPGNLIGEVTLADNDIDVRFGTNNVDTAAAGLTREKAMVGAKQVSLYDGTWTWTVPFGNPFLADVLSGHSQQIVTTFELPSTSELAGGYADLGSLEGPRIVRVFSDTADAQTVEFALAGEGEQTARLTLRRPFLGVGDLHNADWHNPNPDLEANHGRLTYVDHLVPLSIESSGGVLAGFLLLRTDGTSAFFHATPEGEATVANRTHPAAGKTAWTFDLDPDRAYQVFLPDGVATLALDLDLRAGTRFNGSSATASDGLATYGRSLGFYRPDADGKLTLTADADVNFDLRAADEWTFISPEGSRAAPGENPHGEELTKLEMAAANDDGIVFTLTNQFGFRQQYDGRGYLRAEVDRHGNETTYDYASRETLTDLFHPTTVEQLRSITLPGGKQITIGYAADGTFESVTDPTGVTTRYRSGEFQSAVPGRLSADGPVESVLMRALVSALPQRPDLDEDSESFADVAQADVTSYVHRVNLMAAGDDVLIAAAGHIGRLSDQVPEGFVEPTATYRREYFDGGLNLEPVPKTWQYQFDRFGLMTAMAAPQETVIMSGEVTAVPGEVWKWDRKSATGQVEAAYAPAGRGDISGTDITLPADGFDVTYFDYDAFGNLTIVLYADDSIEERHYNAGKHHQLNSYIDRTGRKTTYGLFDNGDVQYAHVDPEGTNALNLTTEFTYTTAGDLPRGLVLTVKSPEGRLTTYAYFDQATDEAKFGLLKSKTYTWPGVAGAGMLVESFDYDKFGYLASHTDVNGVTTVYRNDKLGQLLEERLGGQIDDPQTGVISGGILIGKYTYDAAGNVRTASVPVPNWTSSMVFPDDEIPQVTTTYQYDAYNRLIKTEEVGDPTHGPVISQIAYHADGLVKESLDARAQKTVYVYNERRQLIKQWQTVDGVVAPGGAPLTGLYTVAVFEYDAAGNLKSETASLLNQMTSYAYDSDGRVVRTKLPDPDGNGNNLPQLQIKYVYDAAGNPIAQTVPRKLEEVDSAPAGHTFYDAAGRVIRREGPTVYATIQGDQTNSATYSIFEYYADGLIQTVREGFTNIPGATSPAADGTRTGDVERLVTTMVYDVIGRVKSQTISGPDVLSATTTFDYYTASDNPTLPVNDPKAVRYEKISGPAAGGLDRITWKYFNEFGQIIRVVHPDPDGTDTTLLVVSDCYSYYADGSLAEQWQEEGDGDTVHRRWVKFEYDARGRLGKKSDELGTLAAYTYDALDRVEVEITAGGRQRVFGYDALDRVTSIEHRDAVTGKLIDGLVKETFGYDANGNLIYHADVYGDRVDYQYDQLNRKTLAREEDVSFLNENAQNYSLEKITQWEYADNGSLIRLLPAEGPRTLTPIVDALGRPTREISAPPYWSEPSNSSNPDSWDAALTNPSLKNTRREYDPAGNVTKLIDAENNETVYEYDGLNRLRKERIHIASQGGNLERTYGYDAAGRLEKYTDRNGRVTTWTYDALDRKLTEKWYDDAAQLANIDPPTYTATFAYHQDGNLKSAEDGVSEYQYFEYDERGRVGAIVQKLSIPQAPVIQTTFYYDYYDRLTGLSDAPTARTGYSVYATVNTAVATGSSWGDYLNIYRFDAAGREVFESQTVLDSTGKQVIHSYFTAGAPTDYPADNNNPTPYANRFDRIEYRQFDAARNDLVLRQSVFYERHDARLVRYVEVATPKAPEYGVQYAYNYDQADRLRRGYDRGVAVPDKDYDALGRLNRPGGYTINGNAGDTTGEYNRTSEFGDLSATYDKEGNLQSLQRVTRHTEINGDIIVSDTFRTEETTYEWDHRNRLTRMTVTVTETPVIGNSTTVLKHQIVDYHYDVFNNLIGKRVDVDTENTARVGDIEIYVSERGNRVLSFHVASNPNDPVAELTSRSFYSAGGQVYAVDAKPAGEGLKTHWLTTDRQGNVRDSYRFEFLSVIDNIETWMPLVARLNYEDWGRPKPVYEEGNQGLFGVQAELLQRFENGIFDTDLKAFKFGDRWLSTALHRWLSEDPSGLAFGTNPYEALNNSPYNYHDPDGHLAFLLVALPFIIGGVAGATHGVMETYAANHNATTGDYLLGGGLGALSGALYWPGEAASIFGAVVGGTIEKANGGEFFGRGFQVGGLAGTLVGGFGSAGRQALGKGMTWGRAALAGGRGIAVDAVGMGIGAGIGYHCGGTFESTLHGATLGMFSTTIIRTATQLPSIQRHIANYTGEWRGWAEGFADNGKFSWQNMKRNWLADGWVQPWQFVHHRIIPQGGTRRGAGQLSISGFLGEQWGRYIPNFIKNTKWNMMREGNNGLTAGLHRALHGDNRRLRLWLPQRLWYGSNIYDKVAFVGITAAATYGAFHMLDNRGE